MENIKDSPMFADLLVFAHALYGAFHPKCFTDDEVKEQVILRFMEEFVTIPTGELVVFLVHENVCVREAAYRVVSNRLLPKEANCEHLTDGSFLASSEDLTEVLG